VIRSHNPRSGVAPVRPRAATSIARRRAAEGVSVGAETTFFAADDQNKTRRPEGARDRRPCLHHEPPRRPRYCSAPRASCRGAPSSAETLPSRGSPVADRERGMSARRVSARSSCVPSRSTTELARPDHGAGRAAGPQPQEEEGDAERRRPSFSPDLDGANPARRLTPDRRSAVGVPAGGRSILKSGSRGGPAQQSPVSR